MNHRIVCMCKILIIIATFGFAAQEARGLDEAFDPLPQITGSFPGTIHLDEKRRLLEFCPDNTCDGFITVNQVRTAALRDFAYLYIYFFSDYYILQDWRKKEDSLKTAERILSKPEYQKCVGKDAREKARCLLTDLSRNGKIRLLSVRYDEHRRIATPQSIVQALSGEGTGPKQ